MGSTAGRVAAGIATMGASELFGGPGETAPNMIKTNPLQYALNKRAGAASDPALERLLSDYSSGKISLDQALGSVRNLSSDPARAHADKDRFYSENRDAVRQQRNGSGDNINDGEVDAKLEQMWNEQQAAGGATGGLESQFMDLVQTAPGAAERYSSDRVTQDPIGKTLFGAGGLHERTLADERAATGDAQGVQKSFGDLYNEMSSPDAFKWGENEYAQYGQNKDEIARMSAAQEQDTTQGLVNRGLGAASSGAAGVAFSGMAGNKFEQLANAQRKVSMDNVAAKRDMYQSRMNTLNQAGGLAQGRMQSGRQTATNLGAQYEDARNNVFNRGMQGRQQNVNDLQAALGQTNTQNAMAQEQANTAFQMEQDTRPASLGSALSTAVGAGAGYAVGGKDGASVGMKAGQAFGSGMKK
jgi:hypothetical protein